MFFHVFPSKGCKGSNLSKGPNLGANFDRGYGLSWMQGKQETATGLDASGSDIIWYLFKSLNMFKTHMQRFFTNFEFRGLSEFYLEHVPILN